MCLVYDQRIEGEPGVHALIVGVSDYEHLPPADAPGEDQTFSLRRLTSAAGTAAQIAAWLIANPTRLPRPLATVRLLLAPSASERQRHKQLCALATPPSMANFLIAAEAWRKDAAKSTENAVLFFFSGHGMQGPAADEVLALQDFGAPGGSPLRMAVTTNSLVAGMAPTATCPDIARLQLYFVDACRDSSRVLRKQEAAQATDAFMYERALRDDRQVPKYYAAIPGARARAVPDGTTLFGEAVLRCLGGAGGERMSGPAGWHVSVGSLGRALAMIGAEMRRRDPDIQFDPQPRGDPSTSIVSLEEAPDVEVTLAIQPTAAAGWTSLAVRDGRGEPVHLPTPLHPNPYSCPWPAGAYAVDIEDQASGTRSAGEYTEVLPPYWRWVNP